MPPAIVFDADEHERLHREVLAVPIPVPVRRRLEFFAASSSCSSAPRGSSSTRPRTPRGSPGRTRTCSPPRTRAATSAPTSARRPSTGCRCARCSRSSPTPRPWPTSAATPRSRSTTCARSLPFVLHDKLQPDLQSPAFDDPEREALRTDRVSWIRDLFDTACRQYDAEGLDTDDPVGQILAELAAGLDGLAETEVRRRLAQIEGVLAGWEDATKLHGSLYDDALALKYAHQRYSGVPVLAAVERRVSDGRRPGAPPFGRWLVADRADVDAVLRGAVARGGDRDVVRAAVVDLAASADAFARGRARPGARAGPR